MRGKDFNTGLRGVLFESHHYERMGAAVWLYGWLVLRQTHQQGTLGWVLGGSPVTYSEIEEETGFNSRTLERWMQTLRRQRYIETQSVPGGLVIRITKAKKFPQGDRKLAGRARRIADGAPLNCVSKPGQHPLFQVDANPIGSVSVDGSPQESATVDFHRHFHKTSSSCGNPVEPSTAKSVRLDQPQNLAKTYSAGSEKESQSREQAPLDAYALRQLLRAQRDDAVRRELAVGAGPEVKRR